MTISNRDPNIERDFPAAAKEGYEPTSPKDRYYNCIAWAAGVSNVTWWPIRNVQGNYWPDSVPDQHTIEAFMQAYGTIGYEDCELDGTLELGYEKIVIYVDASGKPTHAARQLSDGTWTSKLGGYKDIRHMTPAALEDTPGTKPQYGTVARYMRRKRSSQDQGNKGG